MNSIYLGNREFISFLSISEIETTVQSLADQINCDYIELNPLFIAVLNGSFIFAADLVKKIQAPCQISFVKLASYQKTERANHVQQLLGLDTPIQNRHIVILEDIVETGNTMDTLLSEINKQNPASVKICTLLFKPTKFTKSFPLAYIGKSIADAFVVGYGFDYDGYGRNLPCIYKIKQ
ncbi:MAG: hypoxanthine phosphoribosyltransferase [Bacteroidales bacterium]